MKLKCLSGFWILERKTGKHIARKIGEEFEMDETDATEAEEIYFILQSGRGTVLDVDFVPKSGRYTVLHGFSHQNEAGEPRTVFVGGDVTLSQEVACRFLVSGHIKPVDENVWTPKKLLSPTVKEDVVKQMFDDPLPKEEAWMGKCRR